MTPAELAAELENRVAFGRVLHEGSVQAAEPGVLLHRGDLVTVVGSAEDVATAVSLVGERISTELSDNRSDLGFRRVLVSNSELAGRRIDELGDHVRVVAPRGTSSQVNALFGDSYRSLRELDVLTFSLGTAAGLLLGLVPLPLPGGGMFTLGFAGGPLIMGLVLGARERTGRLVWQLPHAANVTLRQFGTVLLLAAIGTKAGQSFSHTVTSPAAVSIVIAGAVVTVVMVAVTVLAGGRLLRLPRAAGGDDGRRVDATGRARLRLGACGRGGRGPGRVCHRLPAGHDHEDRRRAASDNDLGVAGGTRTRVIRGCRGIPRSRYL